MKTPRRWLQELLLRATAQLLSLPPGPVVTPGSYPHPPGLVVLPAPRLFEHDPRLPHCDAHHPFIATCPACVGRLEAAVADGTMPDLSEG
jgi:hypothetical protein